MPSRISILSWPDGLSSGYLLASDEQRCFLSLVFLLGDLRLFFLDVGVLLLLHLLRLLLILIKLQHLSNLLYNSYVSVIFSKLLLISSLFLRRIFIPPSFTSASTQLSINTFKFGKMSSAPLFYL